jgi:uncharacterized protein
LWERNGSGKFGETVRDAGEAPDREGIIRTGYHGVMVQGKTRGEQRTPFYFEADGRLLYGCYHEPAAGVRRRGGVVLCYPFGQEFLRVHRSFVQLAGRLANAGFAVLRFDYSGSGDSAGEVEDTSLEHWIADIGAAVEETRRRSGASRISLVGLRLGASLATLAAAARKDVDSLVLWDPLVQGRAYLDELQEMHEQKVRYAYVTPDSHGHGSPSEEFLGFPMSSAVRGGIAEVDLRTLDGPPANRILLIESEGTAAVRAFRESLAALPLEVEHQQLAERKVWLKEPLQGIVPHRLLEAILNWLIKVHA